MLVNCDCKWENNLAVVTDNEPTMNKFEDLNEETEWKYNSLVDTIVLIK